MSARQIDLRVGKLEIGGLVISTILTLVALPAFMKLAKGCMIEPGDSGRSGATVELTIKRRPSWRRISG